MAKVKKHFRWTADIRERAVQMANQGCTTHAIADELNVPLSTIQRWVASGRERPSYDDATRERALEMHRAGASLAEIGRALGGVHRTTVAHWLRELREPIRRHSPEAVRLALERIDSGVPIQDVARNLGIPAGTIHNWIARRDSDAMIDRLYGGDRRARYAIHCPALALALSGAWR